MEVFYEDGNIFYRGGWSHGVPEGNGKYYMNNGKVLWKGEWHNGLFKVKDTNDERLVDYINKMITFTGYFHELNEDDNYIFYPANRIGFLIYIVSYI